MLLFHADPPDATQGYRNLRRAQLPIEAELRDALEALWQRYQPFADADFARAFARDPDSRFWEMYLTVQLLDEGKNVRPRSELPSQLRETGPDIRIIEGARTIWIEAIAPEAGQLENLDRIPDLIPINEGGIAQDVPRRQVELRITSGLLEKHRALERYRERGIIANDDLCVVAISGIRFFAQSVAMGLPRALTAVYPLGDEYVVLDRATFDVVETGYHHSENIARAEATPIPRYAFLHQDFAGMSGLIWSRRTIGNFLGRQNDFVFVHNTMTCNPFPTRWIRWDEEHIVRQSGDGYELTRVRR